MSQAGAQSRQYVSKVGILPSSIPAYHKDYVERLKAGPSAAGADAVNIDEELAPARTDAEKEEHARRLKPHSRSQLRLDESAKRPQGMTPVAPKKPKPVRWQFGIRSRNAPWEALLTIHKALHKLGATYQPDEDFEYVHGKDEGGAQSGNSSFAVDEQEGGPARGGSTTSMDPAKGYKLPADPWHIRVRWDSASKLRKEQSFNEDVSDCPTAIRKHAQSPRDGAEKEMYGTPDSFHVHSPEDGGRRSPFVAMHLDIQIYEMEHGVYLVDFKCSGYETDQGRLLEEKEVTSPFPFLDMAAKLIMQLAEAD